MTSLSRSPGKHAPRAAASRALPLAALVVLALPGLLGDEFLLRFAAEVLLIGTAVMSLNLLIGSGGLVSLGHAAVFGVSAYTAAIVASQVDGNAVAIVLAGTLAGVAMAGLMALVSLRSSGLYFLVMTLVIGQMTWELAFRWRELTGGADGLRGFPKLALGDWSLGDAHGLYALAALTALACWSLLRQTAAAPLGQALSGMRDQPLRMTALGYDLKRLRILAFILTGVTTGAAGALYPFVNQYVGPNVVHWSMSAAFVIMAVLGSIRSLAGGYIGAALYLTVQTYLSSYTDRWQLIIGILFVATVVFMPHGIVQKIRGGKTP